VDQAARQRLLAHWLAADAGGIAAPGVVVVDGGMVVVEPVPVVPLPPVVPPAVSPPRGLQAAMPRPVTAARAAIETILAMCMAIPLMD
jgi:hypothetical protein